MTIFALVSKYSPPPDLAELLQTVNSVACVQALMIIIDPLAYIAPPSSIAKLPVIVR